MQILIFKWLLLGHTQDMTWMRAAHITSSPLHDPDGGTFRNQVTRARAGRNQVRDVTFLDLPQSAGSIIQRSHSSLLGRILAI